jgi:hypothetical protein
MCQFSKSVSQYITGCYPCFLVQQNRKNQNVIPEFETEGETNNHRINKLVIDGEKRRLLIFVLSGKPNYFLELDFLDRSENFFNDFKIVTRRRPT